MKRTPRIFRLSHPLAMAVGLAFSAGNLFAAYESFQGGTKDSVYGNDITLVAGNNTIFTTVDRTTASFTSTLYAADQQAADQLQWDPATATDSKWRPLFLSSSAQWSRNSVTWKLEAPEGQVFDGGTIQFTGVSSGSNANYSLTFSVYSAYSNDGNGQGGYRAASGATLYDSETKSFSAAAWTDTQWVIDLPTGVSVAYVTIAKTNDQYFSSFGKSLTLSGVSFVAAPVPEPATTAASLGIGALVFVAFARRTRR